MMSNECQYLSLLKTLVDKADKDLSIRDDRTGTGTYSLFGTQLDFDLSNMKVPILTTKFVPFKTILHELYWMYILKNPNTNYLDNNNVKIWREWSQYFFDFPDQNRKRGWVKNLPKKDFIDYDIENLGLPVAGLITEDDKKLGSLWTNIMKRCYQKTNHNYRFYGAKGIFVDPSWHNVHQFIKDVKNTPNWINKKKNWNKYELDKDYYNANYYSKESCVWLHTHENNLYIDDPIEIIDNNGNSNIYFSFTEAENLTGIPASSIARWIKKGLSEKCDLKYRQYSNYTFKKINKEGYNFRLLFSGTIGEMYGQVLRNFKYNFYDKEFHDNFDQISYVLDLLKDKPNTRRAVFSTFDPRAIADERLSFEQNIKHGRGVLNPCHGLINQFYINDNNELEMFTFQRLNRAS